MAKVVVFEDGSFDAVRRYSSLVEAHDVHVFMLTPYFNGAKSQLVEYGEFSESQIYSEIPEGEIMPADVYFLDGLDGKCLDIFERLPKDRAFLVTGSPRIEAKVGARGYNIASELEITNIVERVS